MTNTSGVFKRSTNRRRFLKGGMLAGAAVGTGLFDSGLLAFDHHAAKKDSGGLTPGDAALLRMVQIFG